MRIVLSILPLFLSISLVAQIEKTIHQTFSLDSIDRVELNLTGEIIYETWSGASVLTETNIQLYNASKDLLKHFVEKQERYKIEEQRSSPSLNLASTEVDRRPIQYRGRVCDETVSIKVYVPEEFEISGNSLRRKD